MCRSPGTYFNYLCRSTLLFVTDVLLLQVSRRQPDHLVTLFPIFLYAFCICHALLLSCDPHAYVYCNLTCLRASIKLNSVQGSHRRQMWLTLQQVKTCSRRLIPLNINPFSLTHNHKCLPDNSWVELSVNEDHHLKGHGDPQPSNARYRRLNPEHTCERRTLTIRMKPKYFLLVPNLI